MKICFITNNLNQVGGIERVIVQLGNYFLKQGINVSLLSLYSKSDNGFFEWKYPMDITHGALDWQNASRDEINQEIIKFIKMKEPEIVITFHYFITDYLIQLRKKLLPFKLIDSEHASYEQYSWKRRWYNVYCIYRHVDALVILSDFDKEYYVRKKIKRVYKIPNPLSFITEEKSDYRQKKIIAVGRLEEIKGFDMLIKAFSVSVDKHPDWRLEIYGGGTKEAKQEAEYEGLDYNINKYIYHMFYCELFSKCKI